MCESQGPDMYHGPDIVKFIPGTCIFIEEFSMCSYKKHLSAPPRNGVVARNTFLPIPLQVSAGGSCVTLMAME